MIWIQREAEGPLSGTCNTCSYRSNDTLMPARKMFDLKMKSSPDHSVTHVDTMCETCLEELYRKAGAALGKRCGRDCDHETKLAHDVQSVIDRIEAPIPYPTLKWVHQELTSALENEA